MSTLSTNIYGSSTNKGFGGLVSGLDTDDLVNQMLAGSKSKINRQYQAKQKLLYRQEAYREVSTKLLSFSEKYLSYSSGSKTNILSSKFFESYTYKSSSSYVNVTGDAENIKNFSIDSITSVATSANFTSNKKVTSGTFESDAFTDYTSSLAGDTLSIEYDGSTYNLTMDKDFGKVLKDAGGIVRTGDAAKTTLQDVADELNEQLAKITDKDGNKINENNELLKYELTTTDGKQQLTIVAADSTKTAKLAAASSDVIDYLNFKVGVAASSTTGLDSAAIEKLTVTDDSILSNTAAYITFDLNGVTKKINLQAGITDGSTMETYLKSELEKAYGKGKVTAAYDTTTKKITFSAVEGTDIFGVSDISSDLSNFTGIESGDYNRVSKTKSIKDLGLPGLVAKDTYQININGEPIEIKNTMSVTDIVNTINSNVNAGVKVYYSSTTNTFSVKATETGVHNGVNIVDATDGGNLAATLFGTSGVVGTDFTEITSFLNDRLLTDESYEYDNTNKNYKINKNGLQIGTATLGTDNKVNMTFNEDYSSRNENFQLKNYFVNAGTDTKMAYTLNGVQNTITRSTVNFTIDEVNIELNEKAAGLKSTDTPITFDVTNNSDEVVEKFKGFIDSYNEIISLISTKTSEKPNRDYQPITPDQQEDMEEKEIENWTVEAKKGILFGDSKMNSVLSSMRETMSGITSVSSLSLSSIGVSSANMDTSGKLILDEEKFKEKLLESPDEIASLFTQSTSDTSSTAKSGIAVQVREILIANVGAYGTTGYLIDEAGLEGGLTSDQNYISERIEEYDDKIEELKDKMEDERKRYWSKFSSLETTLSNLNSQSSWLTNMLG